MKRLLTLLGPGMLVAATGVGAGDLLTAGLAGSRHGVTLLWAAVAGALLKWFLNEGIARWQMATGTTLLDGWVTRLGRWVRWVFLAYLLLWTVFTGGALVSACGVAGNGFLILGDDPRASKIVWGVVHSAVGALIVWRGGFGWFVRIMGLCVGLMVIAVTLTAVLLAPDWGAILQGTVAPRIPPDGTAYTLGVLGGVGGTLTLLSYGYWIREQGRTGARGVTESRVDLAAGYAVTALFGAAMIVIGSRVALQQGPNVALDLATQVGLALGPAGRWVFLIGFWGAVFSSLLGVWQSAPYLFADFARLSRGTVAAADDLATTVSYRGFLAFIATVPLALLWVSLERAQLLYAVFGALFMPLLALTLLLMNTRRDWVGDRFRNGLLTNGALVLTLAVFGYLAVREIGERL